VAKQIINFLGMVDVEGSSDLSALSRSLLFRRRPRKSKTTSMPRGWSQADDFIAAW
jgi:hypothetical protein